MNSESIKQNCAIRDTDVTLSSRVKAVKMIDRHLFIIEVWIYIRLLTANKLLD